MSVTLTESRSPTAKADIYKVWSTATIYDLGTIVIGSTSKGNQNQAVYMIFEPPIPAGSTLVSVKLDLYQLTLAGTVSTSTNWRIGWLAGDGTWDIQATSLGWDEYAGAYNTMPTPSRTGVSDAGWINNFPSFNPLTTVIGTTSPASGTAFSFADTGGTFNSAAFLTDAQDAFDANETNRTARGVPMAIVMVPENASIHQWSMASEENATASYRPVLTIVYDPPPIAAELAGDAAVDADLLGGFTLATELAGDAAVDADLIGDFIAASELSTTSAVDADPNMTFGTAAELAGDAAVDAVGEVAITAASELAGAAALDADLDATYGVATELAGSTTLDADLIGDFIAASELSTTTTVDAAGVVAAEAFAELSGAATLDAAAEVALVAASELGSAAILDAAGVLAANASSELLSSTVLDAQLIGIFNVATELLGNTTIDARVRPSDTAANPLEVFYMAENYEVRYKADSAIITLPDSTVEVTEPAENIEVGAE